MTSGAEQEFTNNKARQDPGDGLGEILRGAALVFAARILAMALGFGTTVLVARWYGVVATGMVALVNSSAILFGTVAVFGQDSYLMRKFGTLDTPYVKRRAYVNSLKVAFFATLLLAGPVAFALLPNLPNEAQQAWPLAISIILLSLIGATLNGIATQLTRAPSSALAYAIFLLVPVVLSLALVWFMAVFLPPSILMPSAAATLGVSIVGIYALKFNFARLETPRQLSVPVIINEPSGGALMRLGFPFFLSTLSAILVTEGNIVISGVLMPTADLGVYAIAFKLSILAGFGLSTVTLVVSPKLARLAANDAPDALRKYARQASWLVVASSMPILLGLVLGKDWLIITAFGSDFSHAGALLAILLTGQLLATLSGVSTPYLTMTGHQHLLAKIIGFSAFTSCVLTLALTPRFGAMGSAVSLVSGMAIWSLSALIAVRVYDGFWLVSLPSPRRWMRGRPS